jgi:hypothetical protein
VGGLDEALAHGLLLGDALVKGVPLDELELLLGLLVLDWLGLF